MWPKMEKFYFIQQIYRMMRELPLPNLRKMEDTKKALEEIAERLANREQAEEQGLLLRLPCKVGDTVYETYRDGEYCSSWWDIRQRKFTLAFYEKHLNDFHKTVFLTQEEAEARLKDMEDSDGR